MNPLTLDWVQKTEVDFNKKRTRAACGVPTGSFDREKKALARGGHYVVAIPRRLAAKIHGASWSSIRFDGAPRQDRKATIHWVGPMRWTV
jgi:hypothetical protein